MYLSIYLSTIDRSIYLELPVFGLRLVGGSGGGVVHGKVLKFQI